MNQPAASGNVDHKIISLFSDPAHKQQAFRLLVETYQERLYWHIRRMVLNHDDANDVIQNVFMKVWKGLDAFRSDSKLYTWLYRIATNECLSFLRKKQRRHAVSMDSGENTLADKLRADAYFDGDELAIRLQEAIEQLPEKQKIVFKLRYFEEMKYEDMAEVLDTSVGALKASYHHAAKKIEKYITNR